MHLAGVLVAEEHRSLAVALGQVSVRLGRGLVDVVLEGAGHGAQRQHLGVFGVADDKHAVTVVLPMAGNLVEVFLGHEGCLGADIAPLVVLQVLNPALQRLHDFGTLGEQQRQALDFIIDQRMNLADDVDHGEELQLAAQLVVVAVFDVLKVFHVGLEVFLAEEGYTEDTRQRLAVAVAAPISVRVGYQFEALDEAGVQQVRTRAEVHEVVLAVDGDAGVGGDGIEELQLIGLVLLLEYLAGLVARHDFALQAGGFLDDGLHLFLDGVEVLAVEGTEVEVVEEALVGGGTDGDLSLGEEVLHGLSHDMGGGVTQDGQRLGSLLVEELDVAVVLDDVTQIHHVAVDLGTAVVVQVLGLHLQDKVDYRAGGIRLNIA